MIKQLTPSLWFSQSPLYHTNSGIFLSEGEACLIDPGIYPGEIASLAQFVSARPVQIKALVLTHSHWDHILGPPQFPGVPIIAQARYREELAAHEEDLRRQINTWKERERVEHADPITLPRPDVTFEDMLELDIGHLTLHLLHAPGHAADQCVIYEPESAALWAADMLSDLEIPFVSHSLRAYERTLARLSELEIRTLIPGHGHPTKEPGGIRARLAEDRAYLATLRDTVQQAIQAGKTVEETVVLCQSMRYRHPEENRGGHRWNVESVYQELGGQAGSKKLGWAQE